MRGKVMVRKIAGVVGLVLLMASGGGTGAAIWACAVPGMVLIILAGG